MGDLSQHFSAREFACPCRLCAEKAPHVSARLVEKLGNVITFKSGAAPQQGDIVACDYRFR